MNTSVKYKTLDINGINIAYREAGNPENPTIVLLHGFLHPPINIERS